MNIIASREFQCNYQRLEEPVIVKAKSRTLGTWYPKGTEPEADSVTVTREELTAAGLDPAKEVHDPRLPVISKPAVAVRAGVKFSPAPKPGGKR